MFIRQKMKMIHLLFAGYMILSYAITLVINYHVSDYIEDKLGFIISPLYYIYYPVWSFLLEWDMIEHSMVIATPTFSGIVLVCLFYSLCFVALHWMSKGVSYLWKQRGMAKASY
ncbi:MAG: hypothetical protein OEZ58_18285 [Gammaproteobacteria bacterium]|nr:hypothetical protein [Gammaproteobacteria bacterium]MDH5730941.1 hypothetical protein [Gammaproteobacteria bacterium]